MKTMKFPRFEDTESGKIKYAFNYDIVDYFELLLGDFDHACKYAKKIASAARKMKNSLAKSDHGLSKKELDKIAKTCDMCLNLDKDVRKIADSFKSGKPTVIKRRLGKDYRVVKTFEVEVGRRGGE